MKPAFIPRKDVDELVIRKMIGLHVIFFSQTIILRITQIGEFKRIKGFDPEFRISLLNIQFPEIPVILM